MILIKEEVRNYISHIIKCGGNMGIISLNKSNSVIEYASFNLVKGDIFDVNMMNELIMMNFMLTNGNSNLIGLWCFSDLERGTPTVECVNICKVIMDNATVETPYMLILSVNPINQTNLFILNKNSKKEILIPHKKFNKKGVYYDITSK